MTRLQLLNYALQWFGVRLARVLDDDGHQTGWRWLVGIVPLTGWNSPYRYFWRS